MARFITRDHRCTDCGELTIMLHEREAELEWVPCEHCGGPAQKTISAAITKASLVDGNGRFDGIRRQRKLERELQKAKRTGKKDDAARLKRELGKAGRTK